LSRSRNGEESGAVESIFKFGCRGLGRFCWIRWLAYQSLPGLAVSADMVHWKQGGVWNWAHLNLVVMDLASVRGCEGDLMEGGFFLRENRFLQEVVDFFGESESGIHVGGSLWSVDQFLDM